MIVLSHTVKQHIERIIAGLDKPVCGTVDEVRSLEAILLMGTIGVVWTLRPDGTFWEFNDFDETLSPLPKEKETLALAYGARHYPWLRETLPARPAASMPCQDCQGRASFKVTVGEVMCPSCSGLGWVA